MLAIPCTQMHHKLRHLFLFATAMLLANTSCSQSENPSTTSDIELTQLKLEYLQLQKEHRQLLSKITALKQENEVLQTGIAPGADQSEDAQIQLNQARKKISSHIKEYQALQKDYADLKASIAPLASRLQASISAHRKELIGTELGTVVLKNDRQLLKAVVTEINDDSLKVKFDGGLIKVAYADLPYSIQQRFFYDPLLVSPAALLAESPDADKPVTPQKQINPLVLIQAAFAERHRQELVQLKISLQQKIPELESKILKAQHQIKNLKSDRSATLKKFSGSGSNIRRSPVDRDKALNTIDTDIRMLELAIQAAEVQIKSWQKELKLTESDNK